MADKVQTEHSPKKKKVVPILLVIGVIVVAAAAGAGLRWWQLDRAAQKAATPTVVEKKGFAAQDSAVNGDYAAAHKQLAEALDNSHLSSDERYFLTSQQGTAYENQKDYKEALKKYQAAEAIKPTQDVAESIGRVAEASGDKELAISSYKKAILRVSKDSPIADATRDRYEDMIRNLGGQP